jgi:fermentation-respiration switch protein FrsA (DUF1100 family)
MTRRAYPIVVAVALAALLSGCVTRQPPPRQIEPSAQAAAIGTQYRTINFTRGERKLQTTVVWPDAPGRYPIVLFGHGLGGMPQFYAELLKAWAAAGFVVAAPAFPETRWGAQVQIQDVPNQPADLSTVLDSLLALDPSDPLRQRLDPQRVAAAGHSAGAISALGLFTANGPEGRDTRVHAGIILAGNSLGVGERFTGAPVPLLFVHAANDPVVSNASGRAAYRAVPWPKAFLTLPGKEHTTPYMAPADPAFPTVSAATTDFLRWSLLGDAEAGQRLGQIPGLENKLR